MKEYLDLILEILKLSMLLILKRPNIKNKKIAVIGLGYIRTTLYIQVLFLFLFNSLSLPSASRESLFQGLLFEDPVVLEIEIEVFPNEELSEHGYQVLIVGLFVKLELPTVVH